MQKTGNKLFTWQGAPDAKATDNIRQLIVDNKSEKEEVVLICGSFFIMTDVRKTLGINEECDPSFVNKN